MTSGTTKYQDYLRSLPKIYQLPAGWELARIEDLSGYEIRNARQPLTGFCGIAKHDIAAFAEAMIGPLALIAAYRRELESCVRRLAVTDPKSKALFSARALLAELAAGKPKPRKPHTTHRVVIVNNERNIARPIAMALVCQGLDVEIYERGIDALHPLRTNPPDLILLDQTNPPLNGTALFARLVELPAPPIVFVTPHAEEVQKTLSARGTPTADYIASPFSLRDLVTRVTNLLDAPARSAR
jgi:CheY-like chemotaxis protein